MISKLRMFLWRDWANAKSYRVSFLFQNASMLAPLLLIFFMKRTFEGVGVPSLQAYGSDYITFSFVGIIVTTYSFAALRAFGSFGSLGAFGAFRALAARGGFAVGADPLRADLFAVALGPGVFAGAIRARSAMNRIGERLDAPPAALDETQWAG